MPIVSTVSPVIPKEPEQAPVSQVGASGLPVVGEGEALVSELLELIESMSSSKAAAKRSAYRWDGSSVRFVPSAAYLHVGLEHEDVSVEDVEKVLELSPRAASFNSLRESLKKGYNTSHPIEVGVNTEGVAVGVRDGWSRLYLARELGIERVPVRRVCVVRTCQVQR